MFNALDWELNWIKQNSNQYQCEAHAIAVCGNITKRYKIKELKGKIKCLTKQITELLEIQ